MNPDSNESMPRLVRGFFMVNPVYFHAPPDVFTTNP
jgi:hypothetical protein